MTIRGTSSFLKKAGQWAFPIASKPFTKNISRLFFPGILTGTALAYGSTARDNDKKIYCMDKKTMGLYFQGEPEIEEPSNLEDHYADICFQDVNVYAKVNFTKFHAPNERHVLEIQPHLETSKPGVIVSTGTERSFFDLALSAISKGGDKCTGLVVRDIDPQAIGYAHMVTMMLRLAIDVHDFESLSGPNRGAGLGMLRPAQIKQKTQEIHTRLIENQDIPDKAKEFYLKHLNYFAMIYFKTSNTWRLSSKDEASQKYWASQEGQPSLKGIPSKIQADSFQGVQYQKDKTLFSTLQKFAKSGNIICTIGSINDLSFLKKDPLRLVDASNIPDYIPMDLQCSEPCNPRFVWNNPEPPFAYTHYLSYDHNKERDKLSPEQKKEFDQIREQLHAARVVSGYLDRSVLRRQETTETRPFGYYPEHLNTFKEYKERWMIHHPRQGWISFGPTYYRQIENGRQPPLPDPIAGSALKNKSEEELKEIASLPETARFASHLVSLWPHLNTKQYLAFSEVPGWKEAFSQEKKKQSQNIEFQQKFYEL